MLKELAFDLFEEGQTIYFDMRRLRALEKLFGRSLVSESFLPNARLTIDETISGLKIGLQHHYPNATSEFYDEKIEEYFDKSGKGIGTIADLVLKAMIASGVHGKELDNVVNNKKEPKEIKNE